jgi:hypothetical protein
MSSKLAHEEVLALPKYMSSKLAHADEPYISGWGGAEPKYMQAGNAIHGL